MLDWFKDSRRLVLWILVIYPQMIILLYLCYSLKIYRLVQDLPLREEPSDAKEESSVNKDTSSLNHDTVLQSSIDTLTKPHLGTGSDNEMDSQRPPMIAEQQGTSAITATDLSRQSTKNFRRAVLLFSIQLLLAHRAGVLAARQMRQTEGASKLTGVLGITIVTTLVSIAMGFIMNARSSQLRGYRTPGINRALSDPSDPLSRFLFYSWLSLLIPCIRCSLSLVW